ncbi:hypothetical protein AAMO2058_000427600 [Amorphochlora amoebiformis]
MATTLKGLASALLKHLELKKLPENPDEGHFRGVDAVRIFLEAKLAKDHKMAINLGNDLLREGFARHVSGEGAGQFEGTDKAFYALHLPIPSPLPSNRKVNEHASLTVDTKAPQILRSLPNPVHLPGFIKKYHSFEIYRTSLRFYIVGIDRTGIECKLLVVDRMTPELNIREDPTTYTRSEINGVLMMVKAGNQSTGGLMKIATAYGIIGFVRFLYGHYLILITARKKVGNFGGHAIWSVEDTAIVPLTNPCVYERAPNSVHNKQSRSIEARYTRLFCLIQLKQDFYFSYTYDLTRTLQYNMVNAEASIGPQDDTDAKATLNAKPAPKPVRRSRGMYVWNNFLQEPLRDRIKDSAWYLNLIHGYFEQTVCSVFGRKIALTLIARRSRLYAGTRYLKRGISNRGQVANDVEVEQIVNGFDRDPIDRATGQASAGRFSSYVQNRASIPLFWTQQGRKMVAKPEIVLQKQDPLGLTTGKHFMDLFRRYGSPVLAVNLVRQHERRPRESIIGRRYGTTVELLNHFLPDEHKIDYLAWDYKRTSTSLQSNVMDELAIIAEWGLQRNGFFCSYPLSTAVERFPNDTVGLRPVPVQDKFHLHLRIPNTDKTESNGPTTHLFPGSGPTENTSPSQSFSNITRNVTGRSQRRGQQKSMTRILGWLGDALVPERRGGSPNQLISNREKHPPRETVTSTLKKKPPPPPRGTAGGPYAPSPQPGLSTNPNEFSWLWSFDLETLAHPPDGPFFIDDDLPTTAITQAPHAPASKSNSINLSSRVRTPPPRFQPFARPIRVPQSPGFQAVSVLKGQNQGIQGMRMEKNVGVRQRGVMRVNCIDSLDRTNVAQFCVGKCALGYQLHGLGMALSPRLERDARVIPILLDMYERMGDRISMQYGGSEMHRQMANDKTTSATMNSTVYNNRARPKTKEMMIAFMRHYQNTCQDNIKQDALNLLLGLFKPFPLDFSPPTPSPKAPKLASGEDPPPLKVTLPDPIDPPSAPPPNVPDGKKDAEKNHESPPPPLSAPPPAPKGAATMGASGAIAQGRLQMEENNAIKQQYLSTTCRRFFTNKPLGFTLAGDVRAEERDEHKLEGLSKEVDPMVVATVLPGGQGERSGMSPGWRLESIGPKTVNTPREAKEALNALSVSRSKMIVLKFRLGSVRQHRYSQYLIARSESSGASSPRYSKRTLNTMGTVDAIPELEEDQDIKSNPFGRLGSWFSKAFSTKQQKKEVTEETWEMQQERSHWQKELRKLESAVHLWELNSDFYFHNDTPGTHETIGKRSYLEKDWWKTPVSIYESEIHPAATPYPAPSVSLQVSKDGDVGREPESAREGVWAEKGRGRAEAAAEKHSEREEDTRGDAFELTYDKGAISEFDSMLKPGSSESLVHTTIAGSDKRRKKKFHPREVYSRDEKRYKDSNAVTTPSKPPPPIYPHPDELREGRASSIQTERPRAAREAEMLPRGSSLQKPARGKLRQRESQSADEEHLSTMAQAIANANQILAEHKEDLPSDAHYRIALPSRQALHSLSARWSQISASDSQRLRPQPERAIFATPSNPREEWQAQATGSVDPDNQIFRKYLSWTKKHKLMDHLIVEKSQPEYDPEDLSNLPAKDLKKLQIAQDRSEIHGESKWQIHDSDEFTFDYWPSRSKHEEDGEVARYHSDSRLESRDVVKRLPQRSESMNSRPSNYRSREDVPSRNLNTIMGSGSTYIRYTSSADLLKKDLSLLFQHSNQTLQADEYYTNSNSLDSLVPFAPTDTSDFYKHYLQTTVYPTAERRLARNWSWKCRQSLTAI